MLEVLVGLIILPMYIERSNLKNGREVVFTQCILGVSVARIAHTRGMTAWLHDLADQLSKYADLRHLELHRPVPLFPTLDLMLTYNTGAAFNFHSDAGGRQRWLFVGLAIAISVRALGCTCIVAIGGKANRCNDCDNGNHNHQFGQREACLFARQGDGVHVFDPAHPVKSWTEFDCGEPADAAAIVRLETTLMIWHRIGSIHRCIRTILQELP
jgi:hypothetical protein